MAKPKPREPPVISTTLPVILAMRMRRTSAPAATIAPALAKVPAAMVPAAPINNVLFFGNRISSLLEDYLSEIEQGHECDSAGYVSDGGKQQPMSIGPHGYLSGEHGAKDFTAGRDAVSKASQP